VIRLVSSDCALLMQTIHGDIENTCALIGSVTSIGGWKWESEIACLMPARSFSPSGGGKIGGGAAVSEIDEHATNPKHIQTIIRLRIVGPVTIPHWYAGRLTVLGQLDPLPLDIATADFLMLLPAPRKRLPVVAASVYWRAMLRVDAGQNLPALSYALKWLGAAEIGLGIRLFWRVVAIKWTC
jgi:hypothetical protein